MRMMIATILASSLLAYSGVAADAPSQLRGQSRDLSPGKAAGVKQADIEADGVMLWLGVPGSAAGIAVIASQPEAAAALPPPPTNFHT